MSVAILVLNAGSSSLKFSVFLCDGEILKPYLSGRLEQLLSTPQFVATDVSGVVLGQRRWARGELAGHDGATAYLARFLHDHLGEHQLGAVGHRVVHGGLEFASPILVTEKIVAKLTQLVPLAPLHQAHNLKPIRALLAERPELPQVACFDTAFHHGQSELAQAFALPAEITERGVRRYGFHGLSYEYLASVLPTYDNAAAAGRTIVCHLGNGASLCALRAGRSVASTMGFTPLDGIPMGTRCGSLDPGVVLYLIDELKMDARGIEDLLYRQSGLLGVSGVSNDMRTLLASEEPGAAAAVELFTYRIGRELGSLAAALGGLDALVFTAGIGEHAAPIRERICRAAGWLGVELDHAANLAGGPRISTKGSQTAAWVIPTNEELMIAQHTQRRLSLGTANGPNSEPE